MQKRNNAEMQTCDDVLCVMFVCSLELSNENTCLRFQDLVPIQTQIKSVRREREREGFLDKLNKSMACEGLLGTNLILSDDMRHHLPAAGLQALVGVRLKAHLVAVEGGRLQSGPTVFNVKSISHEL